METRKSEKIDLWNQLATRQINGRQYAEELAKLQSNVCQNASDALS